MPGTSLRVTSATSPNEMPWTMIVSTYPIPS